MRQRPANFPDFVLDPAATLPTLGGEQLERRAAEAQRTSARKRCCSSWAAFAWAFHLGPPRVAAPLDS